MLAEANIAESKFNMVFSILDELEGVDEKARSAIMVGSVTE